MYPPVITPIANADCQCRCDWVVCAGSHEGVWGHKSDEEDVMLQHHAEGEAWGVAAAHNKINSKSASTGGQEAKETEDEAR